MGWPSDTAGDLPYFPPLMQMEMPGSNYTARIHVLSGSATNVRDNPADFHLADIDGMRGRWTDITVQLDTSNGNELLEVFVYGGRMAELFDFINFISVECYFKHGIYRSFVSRHGGPIPKQDVVIDEVRMVRTAANVKIDAMRPVD